MRFLAAAAMPGLCLPAVAAQKPAVPALVIPYADVGFPGYAPALMRARTYSMATIHMLDAQHVLLTYTLRSLIPRVAGDSENDSDRLIAAEIIELPAGKVVARTEWRLHDHSRYLWRAGQGVFVLRIADELSTFAPMRGLAAGTPFQRIALPHRPGVPQLIGDSPDGAILTIQVQPPEAAEEADYGDPQPRAKHTTIEFYRISTPPDQGPVTVDAVGPVVGAPNLLRLVLDGDGYLWAEDKGRDNWQISFNEYGGRRETLTTVQSSCPPRLSLLSRGEFLAETCKGTDDAPLLTTYGFDGHENWEEPVGNDVQPPTVSTAPAAGRFALSRMVANGSGSDIYNLAPQDPLLQEIRVYQTESGDRLLKVQCPTPSRTGENFDLSPDGSALALLGQRGIEIYKLRPLTDQDRKDLQDVQAMTPPLWKGPVVLSRILQPVETERKLLKADESGTGAFPGSSPAGIGPSGANPAGAAQAGSDQGKTRVPLSAALGLASPGAKGASDGQGTGAAPQASGSSSEATGEPTVQGAPSRRKPPTLLNPGESPEFKAPPASPE